ncbi:hypothetical protein MMC07_006466 [Pseudocyphellaria aurata]|nr:hypothetical protein [Pseudocyphellaria aurata]
MSSHEPLPYGLKVLADGTDPVLDIVAIHGLNGHREKTWTVGDVNWLRDFLPADIPNARILTWGYDANTHSSTQISVQYLYNHATTLVSDLCLKRRLTKTRNRPIIFVAHSLGGIVVKSALIHSDAARHGAVEEHRSIKLSTYGILFMGTPHQGGSGVQLGQLMLNVASVFVKADDNILKHLERDSEWLQQQLGQYGPISKDFVTKFAYESYPTRVALGKTILVVPYASAIIPGIADAESIAIPADHINMVKFASREDGGYEKVAGHLILLADEAPGAVGTIWAKQALSLVDEDFSMPFSLSTVPEIQNFVGREKELVEIQEEFQSNGSHRKIVLLQGLGGIGKTQLAVSFIKQHRELFSAVIWLNGKSEDMLKQSFIDMAHRLYNEHPSSTLLKTAAESKDPDQVVDAMKRWLSLKANTRWLLVFDNIDNPKLPGMRDPQAYDIKSYFPAAYQGFILITTRSSRLKIGKIIPVKKLETIEESLAILSNMSERQISDQDPHAVELAKRLDGLPLALATAGAYLCQVSTSLADYLHHYSKSWLKLQRTTPELSSYEDRALYSTWDISYEHICSQNEFAGKLLRLWGYFDNEDLWYALLAGGSDCCPEWFLQIIGDELDFNQTIRLLCDHALIESRGVLGSYGMHGCVHSWIIHVLNVGKDFSMAELAISCVGSAVPRDVVPGFWILQQRLLPHAKRCSESIKKNPPPISQNGNHILDAVQKLGVLYTIQGRLNEAEDLYLWVLKGKENISEHTDKLITLHHRLGNVYCDQAKFQKAEEMYLWALTNCEKTLGADHPSTLRTVNGLGNLYSRQDKLKEAEEMYQKALTGYEKALGAEHTTTLRIVYNLGNLYSEYSEQGKIEAAEKMYLRAFSGLEKNLGAEDPSTLDTVNNLGLFYSGQGRVKEAEDMYLRALAGYEKTLAAEHTSTLNTVNNLGLFYLEQGRTKEAEDMFLRALSGREKTLSAEHPATLSSVNCLGNLYFQQSKTKEAEDMYLRALSGKEKTLGPEHTSTLNTVYNLGQLYLIQGKINEAEDMFLRALTGYEKALGANHRKCLDTRLDLAKLCKERNQLNDAIERLELVVQDYNKALGPDHHATLRATEELDSWKAGSAFDEYRSFLCTTPHRPYVGTP